MGAVVGVDHKWKRTKLFHQQSGRELLAFNAASSAGAEGFA